MILSRPALAVACATACLAVVAVWATRALAAEPPQALTEVVASWPDQFELEGMKSEPLYTEHIHLTRDGDIFTLTIDVLSQGDAPLGTQTGAVHVTPDGRVTWLDGCTKTTTLCENDTTLRGFLTTALIVAAHRSGTLSDSATESATVTRELHEQQVLCIEDAALHPQAPATVPLDPCVDPATGAVLAHWSDTANAFVAATVAPGFALSSHGLLH